ncbi:MAG: hypothetical protein QMD11_11240 [Smithella sp.]|nr:hypothetical protein [Smithella sp.]
MKEIVYSSFASNALVIGLISHIGALLIGMIPASGSGRLFLILYLFYWVLFLCAAGVELRGRAYRPSVNAGFYIMAGAAMLPVLGPFIVLRMLYKMQDATDIKQPGGFVSSIFRLRANLLLVFLIMAIIFILFTVLVSRDNPYFQRSKMNDVTKQEQQVPLLYKTGIGMFP